MLTPLPGSHIIKPGSCTLPFFGVEPQVLDPATGAVLEGNNVAGVLVLDRSWPAMLRTIHCNHHHLVDTYLQLYHGHYLTGDGCIRDQDGYYWITGRVDDVVNVSGHRIGAAEVEHALVSHGRVVEAAVVGCPHELKGAGLFCYVILKGGDQGDEYLKVELRMCVRRALGPFAQPDYIIFASSLPKTRSGKTMRRILRKIAENDSSSLSLGDTSRLQDPAVVEELKDKASAILSPVAKAPKDSSESCWLKAPSESCWLCSAQ